MDFMSGGEQSLVFGPRLRGRVSSIMKTAAMANGVYDRRIGAHSPRSGGETALYTQGVTLGVIQRWGRWKSLTSHQYLWRDAAALDTLSEVLVKPHGLLHCLKLMNKEPKSVSFHQNCETMDDSKEDAPQAGRSVTAALFLPYDRFAPGSSRSDSCAWLDCSVFSTSDSPAYTAPRSDHVATLQGKGRWKKQEKSKNVRKMRASTMDGRSMKWIYSPDQKECRPNHLPLLKAWSVEKYARMRPIPRNPIQKVPGICHMGSLSQGSSLNRTERHMRNIRPPSDSHRRIPEQSGRRLAPSGKENALAHF